jgi:1-acyl-sn-glycerol-3-phosphate acyltransferase
MSKTPVRPRRTRKLQTTTARGSGRRSLYLVTHHAEKPKASAHLFASGKDTMNDNDEGIEDSALAKWDPELTARLVGIIRPIAKRYFRSEVRNLERIPAAGALLVSNHSGGTVATDIPILAVDFYDTFGYDRPLYTLSHDILSLGLTKQFFLRAGFIPASREMAARALGTNAVVMVFPGGDHDAMRPTLQQNKIDFSGRTGYAKTAIEAGVPIVPVVSIGGQETQFFVTRGTWLAKRLGLKRLLRSDLFPVSIGFPFGVSIGAVNIPLPSKIITQVLAPIDVTTRFGKNPDIAEVDAHVRSVMQTALDELARARRLPVLG